MTQTQTKNWIAGDFVGSSKVEPSYNPATGELLGEFYAGGLEEAQQAIAAAKQTFETTDWRFNRHLRAQVLSEMADAIDANTEALAELLVKENGKPIGEAGFELSMCAPKLRYWAAQVRTNFGRSLLPEEGRLAVMTREAIGPVGIIVPWNSPVILLIRSLAPVLAAGCTAAVKMPGQTGLVNGLLMRVLADVKSLPAGVVNIFNEAGDEGARELVNSPDTPAISYTGSTHVGRMIAQSAAQNLKRLNLELGGKSPMIVFADANLDVVSHVLEKGVTVFAGQFCMTGSRILAHKSIAPKLRGLLQERLEAVKCGLGWEDGTDMGPMIDRASVERVNVAVEKAIADGARVVVRGGPITSGPLAEGAYYQPTLLEVDSSDLDIVSKETFGPVVTLETFGTEEEAIEIANRGEFGLAASIWSQDVNLPWRVSQYLRAGTVWINEWAVVFDECEEGGFKQSGIGRLNGVAALDTFTEYKLVSMNMGKVS